MKTKFLSVNLILVFFLLFTLTSTAQSTIGLPVQGIARDVNGTARINTQIDLTFDLYYIVGGNEMALYTPSQIESVTTDSFGVFSSIVNTAGRRSVFNSRAVFLRILESGTVISDEQLNSVPYAIAADNGVPTGAIMPFVSDTIPDGWLLCDGATIPTGEQYDALRALYGNNTPDMKGMFLRGAGANGTINTSINPQLNTSVADAFEDHSHSDNISVRSNQGNHGHTLLFSDGGAGAGRLPLPNDAVGNRPSTNSGEVVGSGNHNHTIDGSVGNANSGSRTTETRPMHYVINYIIKL